MSVWWLVVPTACYALVTYKLVNTLILSAIAAGLYFAQSRPEISAPVKPYLPLLQTFIVFLFLGGNVLVTAIIIAAAAAAYIQREALIAALTPWWQLQQQMSPTTRRVAAVCASLVIGYWIGQNAGNNEWTYTLVSIVIATIVTFLLVFTPPSPIRGGLK